MALGYALLLFNFFTNWISFEKGVNTVKGFKLHVFSRIKRKNVKELGRRGHWDQIMGGFQVGLTKRHTWKKQKTARRERCHWCERLEEGDRKSVNSVSQRGSRRQQISEPLR